MSSILKGLLAEWLKQHPDNVNFVSGLAAGGWPAIATAELAVGSVVYPITSILAAYYVFQSRGSMLEAYGAGAFVWGVATYKEVAALEKTQLK